MKNFLTLFVLLATISSYGQLPTASATYTSVAGFAPDPNFRRGDPSDVIKVGNLYYVWYWKVAGNPLNYDTWSVWYATSPDGYVWTEIGEAIPQGPDGSWDDEGTFTPNILVANGYYYLFYTGVNNVYTTPNIEASKTRIGVAWATSPDGPWTKSRANPLLEPSNDRNDFDSHRIDDACLIIKDGLYYLYYKGRKWGEGPKSTKMGVAISNRPGGGYVKYANNPVVGGGHEVLVWPQGDGVATLISDDGPNTFANSIMYSPDGLNFTRAYDIAGAEPFAPGAYRPKAFTNTGDGEAIEWGIQRVRTNGIAHLGRYDITSSDNWASISGTNANTNNIVHITKFNATGFAIDSNGDSNTDNVYLATASTNNSNQKWIEIDRGNGFYSYQKLGTGTCIDGGASGATGQNVYLWSCIENNQNQHWLKQELSDGSFKLIKRNAPGYAIDGGIGGTNGQNIYLWDNVANFRNQQWYITTIGSTSSSSARTADEMETDTQFALDFDSPELVIYPNPSVGKISVMYKTELPTKLEIISLTGEVLQTTTYSDESQSIDVQHLAAGNYVVRISNADQIVNKLLLIK